MPNIFISGAARRIGKNLAMKFAESKYNIAIHYNESADEADNLYKEIKKIGVDCLVVKSDIRDKDELDNSFNQALDYFGSIDILINNAGVFPPKTSFGAIPDELWNDTLNINLRSIFYFSQIFSENAKLGARIINIASVGGFEVWKGRAPYNVSKAAVIQLTKSMALELAPKVSVNCVCPGIIAFEDDNKNLVVPENKIPMGRYGNADDIFDAVRFFAEASPYITGQILMVDGAYHLAR